MDNEKPLTCCVCERELLLGVDVVGRQLGVIGPRGFVPLEEMQLFCNEECEAKHCGEVLGTTEKMQRRIP